MASTDSIHFAKTGSLKADVVRLRPKPDKPRPDAVIWRELDAVARRVDLRRLQRHLNNEETDDGQAETKRV